MWSLIAYILTVPAANFAIEQWGTISVGFGLLAPAGVLFAGAAFTLRDLTQERYGRWVTVGAIGAGGLLSLLVSDPFVAVASSTAFLVSELADFLVYTPLRERGMLRAVAASNVVGVIVDSVLFLTIAFGSVAFLPGLLLAKLYTVPPSVALLWLLRRRRDLPQPAHG